MNDKLTAKCLWKAFGPLERKFRNNFKTEDRIIQYDMDERTKRPQGSRKPKNKVTCILCYHIFHSYRKCLGHVACITSKGLARREKNNLLTLSQW